jgi:hypothetical protein
MDPLKALEDKVAGIEARVRLAVEIAILTETTNFNLSRLATLDPANAQRYLSAIAEMEGK